MNIFDRMHKEHFDDLYGVPDDQKEAMIDQLVRAGVAPPEAEKIVGRLKVVSKGNVYGHAHFVDVETIAERGINQFGYKSITLKISRDGDEDTYDGHIDIEVIDLSH